MTSAAVTSSAPTRLDVAAFAREGRALEGDDPLAAYPRVAEQAVAEVAQQRVRWQALGGQRAAPGQASTVWLHLRAQATVPMTCQRCLEFVAVSLDVDRDFRFVADEETAAAQDDESEEDVLVATPQFDLAGLIEDELVLELPVVARHEDCQAPKRRASASEAVQDDVPKRPHPFAGLAGLKSKDRPSS